MQALQRFLNNAGYNLTVDGIAGTQTKAAFAAFNS
ncbi:peptidoglycan-binding protein [Streptomyces sp. NPDC001657]